MNKFFLQDAHFLHNFGGLFFCVPFIIFKRIGQIFIGCPKNNLIPPTIELIILCSCQFSVYKSIFYHQV